MKKFGICCLSVVALAACSYKVDCPSAVKTVKEPIGYKMECAGHKQSAKTPIYFPYNSVEMTPESKAIADDGLVYLKGHRFKKVQLDGWADEQGGESEYNMDLSRRRAEAIREYMISNGIREDRISVKWHGVDQGNPYEERRRVDVTIK